MAGLNKLRMLFAGFALVAGISLAIVNGYAGNWYQSAVMVATGISVAYFSLRFPINDLYIYDGIASFLMVASICAVVVDSHSLKLETQEAHAELFQLFLQSEYQFSGIRFKADELKIIESGVKTCSMQSYVDANQLLTELMKARWFGPIATLADGLWSAVEEKQERPSCMSYYQALHKLKPEYFKRFDQKYPWAMKDFSHGH